MHTSLWVKGRTDHSCGTRRNRGSSSPCPCAVQCGRCQGPCYSRRQRWQSSAGSQSSTEGAKADIQSHSRAEAYIARRDIGWEAGWMPSSPWRRLRSAPHLADLAREIAWVARKAAGGKELRGTSLVRLEEFQHLHITEGQLLWPSLLVGNPSSSTNPPLPLSHFFIEIQRQIQGHGRTQNQVQGRGLKRPGLKRGRCGLVLGWTMGQRPMPVELACS